MATMGFTQINLHHSRGASAVLARSMAVVHTGICLMQEPWVYRGCIRGIAVCGRLFKSPTESSPRAAIAVKGLEAQLMPEFCSRDVVAVTVDFLRFTTGETRRMVVSSAYFSHEEEGSLPLGPVARLVDYCQDKGLPLIVGVIWGATLMGTTLFGRAPIGAWSPAQVSLSLLEYLVATDLEILNRGNEPIFQNMLRREVLDLTLCSRNLVPEVVGWQVSSEPSFSDHRQIVFRLANVRPETIYRRNPRRTDWDSFREDLSNGLCGFPKRHETAAEVELCVDHLQRALVGSFEKNRPTRAVRSNKKVSWWGPGLQRLREGARRAWNRAKITGRPLDWDLYRRAQKTYRDSVVAAKKESWRRFCESMEEVPEASKFCRILAKNPDSNLQAIRLPDGDVVSGEQCLAHLLETNFPGFRRGLDVDSDRGTAEPRLRALRWTGWDFSGALTRGARADQWAAHAEPESLSCSGLHAQSLEAGEATLSIPLFIPKVGRTCCTSAKDFRPISLTSFILKTLEKLVEVCLRNIVLMRHPLHENQHAYRIGYSTETALHSLVSQIERDLMEATRWGPFWT
ncbi:uncharacterized protein LOC115239096 [Formica exsecta]|uniref:uncharacterized protein LOC115239096 n=1 Tax=Formica exsecta TaxID=72781 RepID=UPI001141F8D1|nr:uncharacterized protein LOC115239096 [Formica exsecta]